MGLDIPPCFKNLQALQQEGVVLQNLSSFGEKMDIWSHSVSVLLEQPCNKFDSLIRIVTSCLQLPTTWNRFAGLIQHVVLRVEVYTGAK